MRTKLLLVAVGLVSSVLSVKSAESSELRILTTTQDLEFLVRKVGGRFVTVDSLSRGTQDVHRVEPKPTFMAKAARADLVVAIGLELESAWLEGVIRGARNPKIQKGASGYYEVGPLLHPIGATDQVSRSQGDVHPGGNPHLLLDPERAIQCARVIAKKLAELDKDHEAFYQSEAEKFQSELDARRKVWKDRVKLAGVKKVITYHKTLDYFLSAMGIEVVATLEPKPGIPPSPSHLGEVGSKIRGQNIKLVLIENFYDDASATKLREVSPSILVKRVPVSVGGAEGLDTLEALYELLVKTIEEAGK